ncbi:MAG: hypothetical protein AAF333_08725 [Planctomycetota bacterium]
MENLRASRRAVLAATLSIILLAVTLLAFAAAAVIYFVDFTEPSPGLVSFALGLLALATLAGLVGGVFAWIGWRDARAAPAGFAPSFFRGPRFPGYLAAGAGGLAACLGALFMAQLAYTLATMPGRVAEKKLQLAQADLIDAVTLLTVTPDKPASHIEYEHNLHRYEVLRARDEAGQRLTRSEEMELLIKPLDLRGMNPLREHLLVGTGETIEGYRRESLPPDDVIERVIGTYVDLWGNPIRYVPLNDRYFDIRSAGPDGVFGTEDDIIESSDPTRFFYP